MRNVFSRRDFLKASAAAVLAASAAGVLTGCDGGAAARSRPQPSGWVSLK